jgi:hypothetical protein
MDNNTQRPYLPLKVEGEVGERFRLLSLAPGNYDDPIKITLHTHRLVPVAHVACRRMAVYLDDIEAGLSQAGGTEEVRDSRKTLNGIRKTLQSESEGSSKALGAKHLWEWLEWHKDYMSSLTLLAPNSSNAIAALSDYITEQDAIPHLEYTALSYTWGMKTSLSTVSVNGYRLEVTKNLEIALRHLRLIDDTKTLWIDALCIDQNNTLERNQQVQLMAQIYGTATETIIWLGPTTDGSDWVLDKLISGEVEDNDAFAFSYRLLQLLSRPWWTRVWVIQEVAYSRAAIIRCGDRSISFDILANRFIQLHQRFSKELKSRYHRWDDIFKGCLQFHASLKPTEYPRTYLDSLLPFTEMATISAIPTCIALIQAWWSKSYLWTVPVFHTSGRQRRSLDGRWALYSYSTIHTLTAGCEATDPRDHVYALLSMCLFSGHQIVADYYESTATVLSKAMSLHVSENLTNAYRRWPLQFDRDLIPELPSWVPNLAQPRPIVSISGAQLSSDFFPTFEVIEAAIVNLQTKQYTYLRSKYASFTNDFKTLFTLGRSIGTVIETAVPPHGLRYRSGAKELMTHADMSIFLSESNLDRLYARHVHSEALKRQEANQELIQLSGTLFGATRPEKWLPLPILDPSTIGDECPGRMLFLTDTGHVGRCPGGVKEGDILAGLFGIDLPFILRSAGNEQYTMVNIAHVMDHEVGPPWRDRDQRFRRRKRIRTRVERKFTIV